MEENLPCAISCYITALVSLRDDNKLSISSTNVDKHIKATLQSLAYSKDIDWGKLFYSKKDIKSRMF